MSFKSQPRKSKRRGVPLPSPSPRSSWSGHKLWFLFSVYLFELKRTLKTQSAPPFYTFPTRTLLFLPHPFSCQRPNPGTPAVPISTSRGIYCLPYLPEEHSFFVYSRSELLFQLEVQHHLPVTFNPRSLGRLLPHGPLRKESNFRLGVRHQRATPQTLSCRAPC